jgi:MFS family permease
MLLLKQLTDSFSVWSMVTSSTTSLFQARFGLTDLQVGLAFLPNGIGCVAGSTITGYLMDYDYRRTEKEYRKEKGIADDVKLNKKTLVDFPIERSRLRSIWWIVLVFVVTTALYGFSLSVNQITLSLLLQFFIAYTATAVFSFNSALVIDLYPGASASATAVNNLMRCSVGAVGVAVIQLIIDAIGAGFAFLALAGLTAGLSPLLLLEWFYGAGWRTARTERLAAEEARKKEAGVENGVGMEEKV